MSGELFNCTGFQKRFQETNDFASELQAYFCSTPIDKKHTFTLPKDTLSLMGKRLASAPVRKVGFAPTKVCNCRYAPRLTTAALRSDPFRGAPLHCASLRSAPLRGTDLSSEPPPSTSPLRQLHTFVCTKPTFLTFATPIAPPLDKSALSAR